ncbi:MAG: cytidylate kinase-like family protein [Verrucomicrobiota bacterium]
MIFSLFDSCKSYISAQAEHPAQKTKLLLPAVTISRETGAGAVSIAKLVAASMEKRVKTPDYPWAIFDRNLVEQVLEDHDLPKRIKRFMPEDAMPEFQSALEEFLGLHPGKWALFEHTTETILRLANAGNCILIGRGSSIITRHLKHVYQVRLVGPVEQRVHHCEEYYQLTHREALAFVSHMDAARQRFIHQHFHCEIDDPLQYHLTINTGRVSFEDAAELIVQALLKMER